jgi:hypothetical protein
MIDFLKKWFVLILLALIVAGACVVALAVPFVRAEAAYAEVKRSECYKKAQEFHPPAEWRWSRWQEVMDSWGDGCEIRLGGDWVPAYLVSPSLK